MRWADICWCCNANIFPAERAYVRSVWETRMDGYCERCSEQRCDAFPGECVSRVMSEEGNKK